MTTTINSSFYDLFKHWNILIRELRLSAFKYKVTSQEIRLWLTTILHRLWLLSWVLSLPLLLPSWLLCYEQPCEEAHVARKPVKRPMWQGTGASQQPPEWAKAGKWSRSFRLVKPSADSSPSSQLERTRSRSTIFPHMFWTQTSMAFVKSLKSCARCTSLDFHPYLWKEI